MNEPMGKLHVKELIVVEGIHDKQAVDHAVHADVWVVGGNRVSHKVLAELKRASAHRGVIVLTDPDGPGEQIRRRIADAIPDSKHAFLPKRDAVSSSGIGVEHAAPKRIVEALTLARATRVEGVNREDPAFTLEDLQAHGLVNHPQAAARRLRIGEQLNIGYGNAKAFLRKLNALGVTRKEWEQAVSTLKGNQQS